jgi:asparagine synthase (glutamine-hydrolysing)
VKTFSITFDERAYDESQFSQLIATKYRTNHHPILLKASDLLNELPNALDAMDSPSVDGMNIYVVSKATKAAGVTVALSGLGADELFAGYHYFRMWYQMKRLGFFRIPSGMRHTAIKFRIGKVDDSRLERLERLALSNGSMVDTYPVFRQVSGKIAAMELTRQVDFPLEETIKVQLREHDLEHFAHLSQMSIAELTSYTLNVLLKDTDQFSMASALEVREPFFDHNLVDYVVNIPDKWKLGKTPKKLLTDAMGELLPAEIVNRPKRGFLLPWEYWLKNELSGFAKERIDYLADRPEFEGDKIQQAWTAFSANPKGTTWPYVWQLVSLSHWMKKNLS